MRISKCASGFPMHTMPLQDLAAPTPQRRSRAQGKRAANLSLSADVLDEARRLQINVSQVCDQHLREVVRRERESRWKAEHAAFIAAHNATLDQEGLPLDEWRSF
jgi:antitoxin CcdA